MPDISTTIECNNIAPIESLKKEIKSNSLKIGIFANNGSGKTFLSRMFRLTEEQNKNFIGATGECATDKLISIGKESAGFLFHIKSAQGDTKEKFTLNIQKGKNPDIPNTYYKYHTFNQDYIEDNIQALNYEKNSEIHGFILGKVNIDLSNDEKKLKEMKDEKEKKTLQIEIGIKKFLSEKIDSIRDIKKLNEYKKITYKNIYEEIEQECVEVKPFDILLEEYNKIKSIPENLQDIDVIEAIEFDLIKITDIKDDLLKKYSLSALSEEFKIKIKSKQNFIEEGLNLLSENIKICPFCEQEIKNNALTLIDQYYKYMLDVEATAIKKLNKHIENLKSLKSEFNDIEKKVLKIKNNFDEYKNKYIVSSSGDEIQDLNLKKTITILDKIIKNIEAKVSNISRSVDINSELTDLLNEKNAINIVIKKNNQKITLMNNKKNKSSDENRRIRNDICKRVFNFLADRHNKEITAIKELQKEILIKEEEIKELRQQQQFSKKERVVKTVKTVLNYFFNNKYTLDDETFRLVFNNTTLQKNQAKNILSEGEKNIIALAYYLGDTHLKIRTEEEYDKLFFIIDDPISSMDFSHVYTLCGVLRKFKQIFEEIKTERMIIFTHNSEFMRVLVSLNIIDKKLLLRSNGIEEIKINFSVPYVDHLLDIYRIVYKNAPVTHTTANSIRHIIETIVKFKNLKISEDNIDGYIKKNITENPREYTLINDLSHGNWRSEQLPITEEEYRSICKTIIEHVKKDYEGQFIFCKEICL